MNSNISRLDRLKNIRINGQWIYEVAFVFYFSDMFLQFTTFMNFFAKSTFHMFSYLALALVLFKIFFIDEQKVKSFVLNLVFLGLLVLTWRTSSDFTLFSMGIFILGARSINFKRVAYLYLIAGSTILLFVMLCSLGGLIPNLVYRRGLTTGAIRQSFGIVYPTDFAAHVLYLILAYAYLYFERISYKSYLVFILLAFFVLHYCDARFSAIAIILLIPVMIIGKRAQEGKSLSRIIAAFYWCVPILAAYAIISLTYFYNHTNHILEKINSLLSGRLAIGQKAIHDYGFSWFGHHMVEHAWGGSAGMKMFMNNQSQYFFVDSSFLRVLILYGVIAFAIILMILTILSYRSIDRMSYALATVIVIISVSAIVEQRLIDISYDPFLIALLANNVYTTKQAGKQEELS